MASTPKSQIKHANKSSIHQNFTPVFVLSLIFGLLSLPCSSALSLSSKDANNIIRYFPYNNERIKYPFDWKKRSGAVNFSPGWGKRSTISQELVFPDEHVDKRSVNFSPGWGKRSGGSVNFSPGWGKRSLDQINGMEDFSDTRFSHQKDLNCKNCDNMQRDDSLPESLDSNNNGIRLLKSDSFQDLEFLTNPLKHPLNQAYLNELRLGIHDWKRSIEDQDYDIENA